MSESPQKANKLSKSGLIAVLLALIVVVLIVLVVLLITKKDETAGNSDPAEAPATVVQYLKDGQLMYDQGAVVMDEDDLQEKYDEIQKEAAEGMMGVRFKSTAVSHDGVNFTCSIGNPERNNYDMYINIYKDDSLEEQILLTGLIPPGAGIQEFTSEIKLEPGTYDALLVLTQVEDDHATLHAQLNLALELVVYEQ